MKKNWLLMLATFLSMSVCTFTLSSCGSDDDEEEIEFDNGDYTFKINGVTVTGIGTTVYGSKYDADYFEFGAFFKQTEWSAWDLIRFRCDKPFCPKVGMNLTTIPDLVCGLIRSDYNQESDKLSGIRIHNGEYVSGTAKVVKVDSKYKEFTVEFNKCVFADDDVQMQIDGKIIMDYEPSYPCD